MNRKEADRARLEALVTPSQSINNYWTQPEQPVTRPIAWLAGAIALPIAITLFLWGMQSGYSRAANDVAAAKAEAAIARSKVAQVKACVEAVQ